MAGVMAALIARHDVEPLGEQIDNLTFALVAPLGANNCDYHHGGCYNNANVNVDVNKNVNRNSNVNRSSSASTGVK